MIGQYTDEYIGNLCAQAKKDFSKLTLEEQQEIFRCYKETQNAQLLEAIMISNDGLVYKTMNNYRNSVDYEDILQEGRYGLLLAIQKFDYTLGNKFSTYATPYIRGHAMRFIENSYHIHIPYYIDKEMREYEELLRKQPNISDEEAIKILNIELSHLYELQGYITNRSLLSLDDSDYAEDGRKEPTSRLEELIYEGPGPDKIYEDKFTKEYIIDTFLKCASNERQKYIFKNLYGIGCEKRTSTDLAREFGITHQAVATPANRAIWKLRAPDMKRKIRNALAVPNSVSDLDVADYVFGER